MKNLAGLGAVIAANAPVGSGNLLNGLAISPNGFEVTQIMPTLKEKERSHE